MDYLNDGLRDNANADSRGREIGTAAPPKAGELASKTAAAKAVSPADGLAWSGPVGDVDNGAVVMDRHHGQVRILDRWRFERIREPEER